MENLQNKEMNESVTWGEYEQEGITFGDIERAGMTFAMLADRKAFNRLLEMKNQQSM